MRLGPEKWLEQKRVFRASIKFENYGFIFEMKHKELRLRNGAGEVLRQEKVVGEKFCLYGEK